MDFASYLTFFFLKDEENETFSTRQCQLSMSVNNIWIYVCMLPLNLAMTTIKGFIFQLVLAKTFNKDHVLNVSFQGAVFGNMF